MPNVQAPNGFQRYRGIGAMPTYEQNVAPINYNTVNIFFGDPVGRLADGSIAGITTSVAKVKGLVEGIVGARFGDKVNPLLVSVRSGARTSMPGGGACSIPTTTPRTRLRPSGIETIAPRSTPSATS